MFHPVEGGAPFAAEEEEEEDEEDEEVEEEEDEEEEEKPACFSFAGNLCGVFAMLRVLFLGIPLSIPFGAFDLTAFTNFAGTSSGLSSSPSSSSSLPSSLPSLDSSS